MTGGGLEYIDQSASALRLNVVEGVIDTGQFQVISEKELICGSIILTARIIGASHILTFKSPDIVFHEIFACIQANFKQGRVYWGPLEKVIGCFNFRIGAEMNYSFRCDSDRLDNSRERLRLLEKDVVNSVGTEDRIGLLYEFPSSGSMAVPKTVITAQVNENNFIIKTAHSYPNENKTVFTETITGGGS